MQVAVFTVPALVVASGPGRIRRGLGLVGRAVRAWQVAARSVHAGPVTVCRVRGGLAAEERRGVRRQALQDADAPRASRRSSSSSRMRSSACAQVLAQAANRGLVVVVPVVLLGVVEVVVVAVFGVLAAVVVRSLASS